MTTQEKQKKEAEKQLLKFKRDFEKLMSKYPHVMVSSDMRGDLVAVQTQSYNTKIFIG